MTYTATLTTVREASQCRQNPSKSESHSDDDCIDELLTEEGQNALHRLSSEKKADEQDDFQSQGSSAGDTSQPHVEKPIEKKFKTYWLAGLVACFVATLLICGIYLLQSLSEIVCGILGSSVEGASATACMLQSPSNMTIIFIVVLLIGVAGVVGITCRLVRKYRKGKLDSESTPGSLLLVLMLFAGLILVMVALSALLFDGSPLLGCFVSLVVSLCVMQAASLLFLHALAHSENSEDIHTYFFEMLAIAALLFGCLN